MNEWLVYVEVEENPNTEIPVSLVFKALEPPRSLRAIRLYDDDPDGEEWEITGWSSEGGGMAVLAFGVLIADSGAGSGHLVWGGDWGIRLRRPGAGPWDIAAAGQRGESYFVMSDGDDLLFAGEAGIAAP